ncbi:MAG TPA: multicopper oxidase domain-containing protein, partial [Rhizomicrobium sp.]
MTKAFGANRDVLGRAGLSRRALVLGAGGAAIANSAAFGQAPSQEIDYTINIEPVALEIAPGKVIKTTGYNGKVPGPVLRLTEGKPVNIKVINNAGYDDIVHWHGLYLPAVQDGAAEEGSPMIRVGQSHVYSFTPKPTGTRWYHSHAMAMKDLSRSTYSGEFGFLI